MTLTIVNHYTHEKTFTVVGEPNGAVKKLRERGFRLNPRIHDDPVLQTDGSRTDPSSVASSEVLPISLEEPQREPSDFFERREK